MNFGLLKNPVFALYVLSNFCTSIGFYIPIFSLPQHLTKTDPQLGMEKANILMIYGIVNTMGRILIGFISDKVFVNRLWVYNFSLTICGIGTYLDMMITYLNEQNMNLFSFILFLQPAWPSLRAQIF